ncbi:MAG: hypothetical protein AB1679_21595 [Actinomycetota bacterium]
MEVRDDVLPKLQLLATRFEKTSRALRTYAEGLSKAQHDAEYARLKAKAAETTIDRAERELAAKAAGASTSPLDPTAVPVFTTRDPDQIALDDGQSELSLARQLLADAEHLRDEAAGRCARAIDDAIHDDLRNEGGGIWGGIKRFAKNMVDDFPYVDEIARFAGLASGTLGLLSLIPPLTPFLAPAAAVAGGISLLANSTLAAAGEQGWSEAGWDAAGLLTFGLGRLATASSRMAAGSELAREAGRLREFRLAGSFAPFEKLTPLGSTRLHTSARHLKESAGIFGRAAKPFLDTAGRPVGPWSMIRSSAAFWRHAELPGREILAVAPRAAVLAGISRTLTVIGGGLDTRDIYNDPAVKERFEQSSPPKPSRSRADGHAQ